MHAIKKYLLHMAKHAIGAHKTFFAAKPPISPHGDALFSFVNNSGKTAFIQVVGRDPVTKKDFFVKYDPDGTFVYSTAYPGEDSTPYAYPSTFFADGDLYLPTGDGMRLYVSIDKPVVFMVNTTINGPDPHNPSDPNHNLLCDKIEFNIGTNAIFVNPTAVDLFALPLHVEQTDKEGKIQDGGLTVFRSMIFDDIKNAFAGTPFASLVANGDRVVFSPKDGAATGFFPNDYFVLIGWLKAFKKLFSIDELVVDMGESFPPSNGGGIWRGLVANDQLVFIRDEDDEHPKVLPVYLVIPTTVTEWIGGAGPHWNATTELERAMVRNITSAVETNTLAVNVPLCKSYFDSRRAYFYQYNNAVPVELQFVDLYSKVLHSYGDHNVYTYAYDDELNQSGSSTTIPSEFTSGTITLGKI
jgi:hypothetical protein